MLEGGARQDKAEVKAEPAEEEPKRKRLWTASSNRRVQSLKHLWYD